MRLTAPYADPEEAAGKLFEIANTTEAVQDGRIYIELMRAAFLATGGSPAEYRAGLRPLVRLRPRGNGRSPWGSLRRVRRTPAL